MGIAGLIASLLSFRRRKLCYNTVENSIVSENSKSFSKLRITYGKKEIPFLYSCSLTLWNRGSAVIEKKHIAAAAPLRLTLNESGDILECFLDVQSRPGNNIMLSRDASEPNTYNIEFDYLNPGDGCRIIALHTSREMHRIRIQGEVIGGAQVTIREFHGLDFVAILLLVTICFSGSIGLGTIWMHHMAEVARGAGRLAEAENDIRRADVFTYGIVAGLISTTIAVAVTVIRERFGRPRLIH